MTKRDTIKIRKTRQIRKTSQIRKTKKTRQIRKTRRLRLKGGGETEIQIRENFRKMFINSFITLQKAINKKPLSLGDINKAIANFKNGFKGNQKGINTLIPVTINTTPIDKYITRKDKTPLIDFVPPLVVIFHNIRDM